MQQLQPCEHAASLLKAGLIFTEQDAGKKYILKHIKQ